MLSMIEHFIYSSTEDQLNEWYIQGRRFREVVEEVQQLYLNDDRPWVVGYSGGKDSTVILQIVFTALLNLHPTERLKNVYVVTSDTLVETPVVVDLIMSSILELNEAAKELQVPIKATIVKPKFNNTFWVNLLGKGYSAPTQTFRWCTERMKINPVSEFILDKVAEFGEAIIVLGSRRQESASRAQVIAKYRIAGSQLARHTSLPNAFVYMPIEDWSSDEVWEYLMSAPRPWGGDNRKLLELYRGSNSGECPIVIDTSTPSCGNSRFGCWTCTVVSKDHAMESLVENGSSWMRPLLKFRNMLAETTKPEFKSKYRNYRRRTGKVTYARNSLKNNSNDSKLRKFVPGPYWMKYRKKWLTQLLEIEKELNENGHNLELVTRPELHAIRTEWLNDPNEPDWNDSLPNIFKSVYGFDLDWDPIGKMAFSKQDRILLDQLAEQHGLSNVLVHKLMELQVSKGVLSSRRGLFNQINSLLTRDWEDLEAILSRESSEIDRGFENDIFAYQLELDKLSKGNEE